MLSNRKRLRGDEVNSEETPGNLTPRKKSEKKSRNKGTEASSGGNTQTSASECWLDVQPSTIFNIDEEDEFHSENDTSVVSSESELDEIDELNHQDCG